MELINLKTQRPEDVSPDEFGHKFMSGQYGINKSQPVFLMDPEGNIDQYIPEDVHLAVTKGGYTFPTGQDLHEHTMQQKYGDRPYSSFGLGLADSATFGMASQAASKTGLTSEEALKEIPERNPYSHLAGSATGIVGSLVLSPEAALVSGAREAMILAEASGDIARIAQARKAYAASKQALTLADALNPVAAVSKIGHTAADAVGYAPQAASAAQKILYAGGREAARGAAESALYTAGEINREDAVGAFHGMQPEDVAGHIFSELGFGTVLGGGLGGTLGSGIEAGALAKGKVGSFVDALRGAETKKVVANEALANSVNETLSPLGQKIGDKTPTTFSELEEKVRNAGIPEAGEALPSKQVLLDAKAALPEMELPILGVQLDALENKYTRDQLSLFSESGSKEAQALNAYKDSQKAEALNIMKKDLESLAPGTRLATDEVAGGRKAIQSFQDQYDAEKKELAPIFKKFDGISVNPASSPKELVEKLEESIPGLSPYLEGENGALTLAKYDPGMPFSKNVYSGIKDLVTTVNKEGVTLGEIRNLRNTIADRINLLSAPRDAMQIGKLKSSLMDYIGSEINKVAPEINAKELFKRYAINEQNRQVIESIFGGKFGDNVNFAKKIIPEDVLKSLFSDSVTVQAAKEILGPQAFNEALANYLSTQIAKVSDPIKNGFSSAKFATFLKTKGPELAEAFKGNDELLKRLGSATDIMRILPDAPSANPSGSGKAAYTLLKDVFSKITHPIEGARTLLEDIKSNGVNAKNRDFIAEMLNGSTSEKAEEIVSKKLTHYNVLHKMDELLEKSSQRVIKAAKSAVRPIERASKEAVGPVSAKVANKSFEEEKKDRETNYYDQLKDYDKFSKGIGVMATNQTELLRTLEKTTAEIFNYIPKTSQGVQSTVINGVKFLNSKMPQNKVDSLFSEPKTPTPVELQKFFKYYKAVENPLSVLDGLKTNNVAVESLEALQAVYPQFYNAMRASVLDQASGLKEKPSYQKRLALSLFLGQDIDSSLAPQMVLANQMNFNMQRNGQSKQADGAVKPTGKGMGEIDLANRALTSQEMASQRKESRG